jgi:D-alanyl-D-alanine carboxypeptidase (penicillin-binding protein 5/6)
MAVALVFCLLSGIVKLDRAVFAAADDNIKFDAKSAFLMDYHSNEVLFASGENEKLPVASIVKLMTILLTAEHIAAEKMTLEDKVTASGNAAGMGGSQVFIDAGWDYSVGDLLKSVIIASANDASVALAETIAGSEEGFVSLMNKRAKELGLNDTNYENSTGLPSSNQFSTARDIAILLKEVMKHDVYHKYSTIWMDKLTHRDNRESEVVNTNKLVRYYNGCDGGKTGSTNEAGFCLAASAKRGDLRVIAVILGATTGKERFAETSKLFNYGFANFENKKVVSSEDKIENSIKVLSGKQNTIELTSKTDLYVLSRKSGDKNYDIKIELETTLRAPVKAGDVAGKVYVIKNGAVIGESEIVSTVSVAKATIIDNIIKSIQNWEIAK